MNESQKYEFEKERNLSTHGCCGAGGWFKRNLDATTSVSSSRRKKNNENMFGLLRSVVLILCEHLKPALSELKS